MAASSSAQIDLFKGWPSDRLYPTSLLQTASHTLLSESSLSIPALIYGADPGPSSLLETLSEFLSDFYSSSWTNPSRLTITGGASQSLACILQVFSDPSYTKNVYMVAPTYFLACRIFEDNGFAGRLRAVPEDEEGINLERLEHMLSCDELENGWLDRCPIKRPFPNQKLYQNILYCVPTFSNPSGKTMTLRRREQLVRLARRYHCLIITDDVYDLLHWDPKKLGKAVLPRLVDVDHTLDGGVSSPFGNVVSNGSFSKILGPGLRTGWTESTAWFAEGLSQCGSTRSGGSPSQFTASVIAETLRTGALVMYLNDRLIPTYRRRSEIALEAVKEYLLPHGGVLDAMKHLSGKNQSGEMILSAVQGGYYIYVHLPDDINATSFAQQAEQEENIVVGSGENFEVWGDAESVPIKHALRICFAYEDEDLLVEGIRRLGKVLKRLSAKVTPGETLDTR
ncbi:uncharacterized protein Z518_06700 [Rhinocladiella mackenziei CBS 650.93]|uniref:Aminotransferase class I/classII large domain-containing protein n=1 Tax=Rhinocladiella mackenziei CBS 650.93 TaxID=1442369 RepID=A0A0D2IBE7_9EURO|nr:uncharacterized protein Z518_06700 [Rhinocladiella mackenziei CBS 650.93]KIX03149.1 hypothetical protein Z518_06700 [Rhinocladiella mackenziei CBS 650.93]